GASSVFVNYDGVSKQRSVVGDHVRVGSDTMIVAPVGIGDGAYTAAGSAITQDVPPGAMAVAGARQRNVAGWTERRRAGTPATDAFVIQSHTTPINDWVMESLLLVDALKRASAKRITVVAPFYPYARQDKKHRGREPISARLIADMFKTSGADRLMTVDLHTSQAQGFFDGPVDHLFALPLLADYVDAHYDTTNVTVVAPDSGRVRVAERWTERLGGTPLAFIHKTRDINVPNSVVANRVVGEVEGRTCIIVDDMIDTAGTITKAADALFDAGAQDVLAMSTHGVLSDPATDRLKN